MSALVVLPLVVPAVSLAAGLAAWRRSDLQAWIGVIGAGGLLIAAALLLFAVEAEGFLVSQMGDWPAPFGITLVADRLAALLVGLAGVMGLVAAVYALGDRRLSRSVTFFPALHGVLLGVCGAFLTGDLFNLYVWFEVLLISSFVLMVEEGGRAQIEGAWKYVVLNLLGSMAFLIGVGLLYGATGTLNMADLHRIVPELQAGRPGLVPAIAALLLFAFALKAALFPLSFWLPASYHTPSPVICALFAALLAKVGVYSLVRVFTLVFPGVEEVPGILFVLATVTIFTGVLGAVSQFEIKKILAWHSVSQVGYIVVGVGLLASESEPVRSFGLAATVLFLVHHGLVKPALFLIGGLVGRRMGTTELGDVGGLSRSAPWLAALFLVASLSLAGLPPTTGFWAKLAVVRAALIGEHYLVATAALAAGLLTLISMTKIWNEAFWKPAPAESGPAGAGDSKSMRATTVALVALIALLGLAPQSLVSFSHRAAEQLLQPEQYLAAVGIAPPKTASMPGALLAARGVVP